jgi:NAD(P)-dependent dehydrogenase (short-subunit alcohol dehydrogenase family)
MDRARFDDSIERFNALHPPRAADAERWRRAGEPIEVARLAVFLCSDDAAYVNGAHIAIDRGKSAID